MTHAQRAADLLQNARGLPESAEARYQAMLDQSHAFALVSIAESLEKLTEALTWTSTSDGAVHAFIETPNHNA